MKRWSIGTGAVLACLLGSVTQACAGGGGGMFHGGYGGVNFAPGNLGSYGFNGIPTGNFAGGAAVGGGGMMGMCGCNGILGMSGFNNSMSGMCGFGGFCCGGMGLGYTGYMPTHTYAQWTPSPNKAYYHRTVQIQTMFPNEQSFEFVLVHYPDRPKYFYYFDPLEKKYVGRYVLNMNADKCFNLIAAPERKAQLKMIGDSSFRNVSGMPSIAQISGTRAGTVDNKALQAVRLSRPPETIPDELLGLPLEELLRPKKTAEKK